MTSQLPPAQSPDEIFDVVDEADNVIEQRTRGEVHRLGLLHRAVHIFVFNSDGQLLLQKRSAAKDEYPSTWTSSASGHVDSGEDYDTAAAREIVEELGISSPLASLHKFSASKETSNEFVALYSTTTDATPVAHPSEIDSLEFVAIKEVIHRIETAPASFAPSFVHILQWYLAQP